MNYQVAIWKRGHVAEPSYFVSSADSVWCTTGVGPWTDPVLVVLFSLLTCFCLLKTMVSSLIYADDTHGLCRPSATLELQNSISTCIDDVARWMRSNRLQLNTAKTEILWSTSSRRLNLIPVSPIRIGTVKVMPVSVVRHLGIYINAGR